MVYDFTADLAADPLPFALWIILAGLIVRIGHSSELAPEFFIMIMVAFVRCTLWLSGHIGAQNSLGYAYPACQILAAEEAIRVSGYVMEERMRSARYSISLCFGLFIASIAWYRFPGGIITWRACSHAGIFAALAMSSTIAWRFRLGVPVLWRARARHDMLLMLMLASAISSRPGGEGFTAWTEIAHCLIFVAVYWTFPRAPRNLESISASSSVRAFSAAS